jgi:hypothetical protein
MAGNYLYRPPNNRHFNPITGEEEPFPPEDEAIYQVFGNKYSEIINKQPVKISMGQGGPPRNGANWGIMVGWAFDHYGVFSWVPEIGSYQPFCDYDKDGKATEIERLRWNDEEWGGKIFVDWKPYNHPQLGKVEIGGFVRKLYNPKYKTYTNLMCYPGPVFEDFLVKHTKWNLYLVSMSPYVRIIDVEVTPGEAGYFKIAAKIQNQGFLPTNVTQQAVRNRTAKTVKATISLAGATLVMGKARVDVGHLRGHTPRSSSPVQTVEWMVKASSKKAPTAVINVISEKGGTHTKKLTLTKKR